MTIEYEKCSDCGNDTFKIYFDEQDGIMSECAKCGLKEFVG